MRNRALILAGVIGVLAGTVRAQEAGDPRSGHSVALRTCGGCHAVEKGQSRSADPRAPPFDAIAGVPGMTAAALSSSLHTSHRAMPDLILPAEDLRDVVAYILSLQ